MFCADLSNHDVRDIMCKITAFARISYLILYFIYVITSSELQFVVHDCFFFLK